MKDIFTDLYNKVLGFFRQTDKKEDNAKDIACNRLRVVLMQDRTNLTPELMEKMRQELIDLLSKYVEMDKEALELNFEQEGNQMALMLSIPVLRAKDEAEIERELAKEQAEKESREAENSGEKSEESEDAVQDNGVIEIVEETPTGEIVSTEETVTECIEIVEPENEKEKVE
ncbi:cell division topological specificity factor MinE [Spirochaetes bacterium]|uniref:Cell division topological specificity factor n=1 Tax=Candidatus Scatousia excrementipullorum TaxID=2840936 RepID=A0A9D9GYI2_9BACT|nr:cell division topological specificity factor MinE [Candidatus Scatousia excrementipullorum]